MNIIRKNEEQASVSIGDLKFGDCFKFPGINSSILMKVCTTEEDDEYNTVNLQNGCLTYFDKCKECVPLPYAEVIVDFSKMKDFEEKKPKIKCKKSLCDKYICCYECDEWKYCENRCYKGIHLSDYKDCEYAVKGGTVQ